jgi:hypothetical protein
LLDRTLDFRSEPASQPRRLRFVVEDRFDEVHLSFGMELESHRARSSRTRANTCSPGMPFTRPSSNSWCRLFASAIQALSIVYRVLFLLANVRLQARGARAASI